MEVTQYHLILNMYLTHDTITVHCKKTPHITQQCRECQKYGASTENDEILTDFNKIKHKAII
jgi:hypothetical protein